MPLATLVFAPQCVGGDMSGSLTERTSVAASHTPMVSTPVASRVDGAERNDKAWTGDHALNLRFGIPLVGRRFYVTLVAGRERRSPERRAAERLKHPLFTRRNVRTLSVIFGISFVVLTVEYLIILPLIAPKM